MNIILAKCALEPQEHSVISTFMGYLLVYYCHPSELWEPWLSIKREYNVFQCTNVAQAQPVTREHDCMYRYAWEVSPVFAGIIAKSRVF